MKNIQIISEGKRRRECVEISSGNRGERTSHTFHQTLVQGKWVLNTELPEDYKRQRSGFDNQKRKR